jgi:hypothetical protein
MSDIAEKEVIKEVSDRFVVARESEEDGNTFTVTVRASGGNERTFRILATSRSNKILKYRSKKSVGQ